MKSGDTHWLAVINEKQTRRSLANSNTSLANSNTAWLRVFLCVNQELRLWWIDSVL